LHPSTDIVFNHGGGSFLGGAAALRPPGPELTYLYSTYAACDNLSDW
jgi:hypothetical protein